MYETCAHVCEAGCSIYPARPEPCQAFRCQWLRGVLEVDGSVDPAMRPDACGVIVDFQPQTADGDMYTAWEIESGASDTEPAKAILEGLQEQFLVMIVSRNSDGGHVGGERRFVGPTHRVVQAQERMARSSRRG